MTLSWSTRRQLLYTAVAVVVGSVILYSGYATLLTSAPTCFDGNQNQGERGADCGGPCSLACKADTHEVTVLWSRAFQVSAGRYTAAAYVQGNNVSFAAKGIKYSFQLFDDKNLLVAEREGVVDFSPLQTIPIVETNIDTGTRTVSRTLFAFSTKPVWYTPPTPPPALRVTNNNLASDGSSLSATIVNDTIEDAHRTTVTAVLFDQDGIARAASKSVVDVPKKSSQNVVFTWPTGTPNVVRAEITVLPSI